MIEMSCLCSIPLCFTCLASVLMGRCMHRGIGLHWRCLCLAGKALWDCSSGAVVWCHICQIRGELQTMVYFSKLSNPLVVPASFAIYNE